MIKRIKSLLFIFLCNFTVISNAMTPFGTRMIRTKILLENPEIRNRFEKMSPKYLSPLQKVEAEKDTYYFINEIDPKKFISDIKKDFIDNFWNAQYPHSKINTDKVLIRFGAKEYADNEKLPTDVLNEISTSIKEQRNPHYNPKKGHLDIEITLEKPKIKK